MTPGNPILMQRQCSPAPIRRSLVLCIGFAWSAGCEPHPQVAQAPVREPPVVSVSVPIAGAGALRASNAETGRASSVHRAEAARAQASAANVAGSDTASAGIAASSSTPPGISSTTRVRLSVIAEAVWTELSVPEFEPAVVSYRAHAPLFVVTHGAGGNAEWHCRHVDRLLGGRASLICPRGKRRHARDPSQGYYYPDHLSLRREVHAAVEQFEARVPEGGATRPYTYAGYSQGATMGALAFAEEGRLFSHLLLVEGGYADWSSALVNAFQRSGGHKVLLVCGTGACHRLAHEAVERFTRAGLQAKDVWAMGAGHRPDGAVGATTSKNLTFLLNDNPSWQDFSPVPEDSPVD
jgi:predicted esterase